MPIVKGEYISSPSICTTMILDERTDAFDFMCNKAVVISAMWVGDGKKRSHHTAISVIHVTFMAERTTCVCSKLVLFLKLFESEASFMNFQIAIWEVDVIIYMYSHMQKVS